MNKLKQESRKVAGEVFEVVLNKIDNEMNLSYRVDKFDALFYMLEFIAEKSDIVNNAYKNEDFAQIRRDISLLFKKENKK